MRRIHQEYFPYIENTPVDIKLSPSRRIIETKFQILNHLPRQDRMGEKNILRYCSFKGTVNGEYTKRIYTSMENGQRDMNVYITRLIIIQIEKNFRFFISILDGLD
jgi:hypothetical protein